MFYAGKNQVIFTDLPGQQVVNYKLANGKYSMGLIGRL